MIKISIEMVGENIVLFAHRQKEKITQLIPKLAENVKDISFLFAPRRTGRLASSIQVNQAEGGFEVLVDVPYAAKVERDAGFFFKAVSETEERLPQYLRDINFGR